nr:MAG: ORF1 [Torque teno midi virus]
MPFWWNRRRKPWYTRFKYKRRTYRRRRKRFPRRRRRRRLTRRRRRRRTKVKKKKPFLKLLQWQPDSIRKCKIKAVNTLLLGTNGMQHRNYTTDQNEWTFPKNPGGGGFSTTVFSLQYLYELYTLKKCIWTKPNINYDLCRYTGCKFTFFRHPWWDFIITTQLMYPMSLSFPDYIECQPLRMLLQQRKIVVLSLKHKPNSKIHITKKFRPPKQMVNKWFFQDMFANKPLLLLKAAVCDLLQPELGPSGGNKLITLNCINIHKVYMEGNWGTVSQIGYMPVATMTDKQVKVKQKSSSSETTINIGSTNHNVNYLTGWFQKQILQAYEIKHASMSTFEPPTYSVRYNPAIDTGKDNMVYLCSIHTSNYKPPTTDKVLYASNQPLWMLLFGFVDYIAQIKKPAETMPIYYLLLSSPYIEPQPDGLYPKTHLIIDQSFINGQGPFNTTTPNRFLNNWYPTLFYQQESISNIVKCGPFIPKPDPTKANWELHYKCTFYFKWGGSIHQDTQITNPTDKKDYPVPDSFQSALQVVDPQTQIPETMLHAWDFRRDYITKTALKRMSEHFETESILSTDSDSKPPAKRCKPSACTPHLQDQETKTQTCLLSLFEENTCQEQEEETETSLKQLIHQQQQQQQTIKLKLLQLITHMKRQQHQLQLNTGLME